jgi:hypothetical protein
MRLPADIRVKTDIRHEQLYRDLRPHCGEAHAVFFLCVCLAARQGVAEGAKAKRAERFFSGTIEPDEWAVYHAIAVRDHGMDFSVLEDPKLVLAIAESYADQGMQMLIDGLLCDYMAGSGEELKLDSRAAAELPWELLKFIPDQLVD